jgi:hypothetical protein
MLKFVDNPSKTCHYMEQNDAKYDITKHGTKVKKELFLKSVKALILLIL